MPKKISKEEFRESREIEREHEEQFNSDFALRMRERMREQFGPLALGDVEIAKAATIQVEEYHPIVTSIAVRVPIEANETTQEAIRRVRKIVEEELTDAVGDVINDKLLKYAENARLKR